MVVNYMADCAYVCVCVAVQPLGRTGKVRGCCCASQQLDSSHLCARVQNKPVLNSKRDQSVLGRETKIQMHALSFLLQSKTVVIHLFGLLTFPSVYHV